jgi:hypothetical protein
VSIDKLNAEFLVAVLNKSADAWPQFEDLLRATVASQEPLAVLKLLELYEMTMNAELQTFLGNLLLARSSAASRPLTVDQVADQVRRALGVTVANSLDDQWRRLARDAQRAVAGATAAPDQPDQLLSEAVTLAHHSTLACALANGGWGDTAVDALQKAGPKALTSKDAGESESAAAREADSTALAAAGKAIGQLQPRRPLAARLEALSSLADLADTLIDLPPVQAAPLATYLLSTKSGTEHERILDYAANLGRWNSLLLTIADRLEGEGALPERGQLQSLLGRLLGRDIVLGEGPAGRAAIRSELRHAVLDRLNRRGATPQRSGEAAATALFELYRQQARTLNLPISDTELAGNSPSGLLRPMIREWSSRLSGTVATDAARRELARMPYDLAASEFVAVSDVQLTVMLERMWLKLLELECGRRDESRSADAARLVSELQGKDRAASNVLTQLRDGQMAVLRMWLLVGGRN